MAENDEIVSRYMEDIDFQKTAYEVLTKDIYERILSDIGR